MAEQDSLLRDFERRFETQINTTPAHSHDGNKAWNYFSRLGDTLRASRDPYTDAMRFEEMWCQVPSIESARQLTIILHNVAEQLRDSHAANSLDEQRLGKSCLKTVRQNIQAWEATAIPAMPEMTARHLAMVTWAMGTLSARPSDLFANRLQEQSIKLIDTFASRDLANMTWAMARLAIKPTPEFLAAWEKQARDIRNAFEPRHLTNSIWAMAVFNTIGKPDGERSAAELIDQEIITRTKHGFEFTEPRHREQIVDARMPFHYENGLDLPEESDRHSKTEINLAALFQRVGLDVRPEKGYIPLLHHHVDIPILTPQGIVDVEVDGIHHFAYRGGAAGLELFSNGNTRLQTSLITQAEPQTHVLRVPFRAAENILDKRALATKPLHDAVQRTMELPPGAYTLRFDPSGITGTASVVPFFEPHLRN